MVQLSTTEKQLTATMTALPAWGEAAKVTLGVFTSPTTSVGVTCTMEIGREPEPAAPPTELVPEPPPVDPPMPPVPPLPLDPEVAPVPPAPPAAPPAPPVPRRRRSR